MNPRRRPGAPRIAALLLLVAGACGAGTEDGGGEPSQLPEKGTGQGTSSGFRTDSDLLFGGAPTPEREEEDAEIFQRELRLQTRLQLQYEATDPPGGGVQDDLLFRRALMIGVWNAGPGVVGKVELDARAGKPSLNDLFFTFRLRRWSRLWLGQFKTALSRSVLISSGEMIFTDRSAAAKVFAGRSYQMGGASGFDRLPGHGVNRVPGLRVTRYWYFGPGGRGGDELGIRFRGDLSRGPRNGRSEGELGYTLRLEVHPDGNPSYREGNRKDRKQGRLSFDVAYRRDPGLELLDLDGDGVLTSGDRHDREILNLGFLFRRDRLSTRTEVFRQQLDPHAAALATRKTSGFYTQLGWVWESRVWESGLRYSEVDPAHGVPGDDRKQWTVSLVRYIRRNLNKAILEYEKREDEARPSRDDQTIRLQYQWTF